MAFGEAAQLVAILKLNNQFSGPLAKASRDLSKFDSAVSRSGSKAYIAGQQIGNGIRNAAALIVKSTALVATAVAGIAVASLRAAGNFEAQLNTINTIARAAPAGLKVIGDSIRKVARDTGTSLDDLTTGYYDLLSAGIKTADATNVLNAANRLAIGGLGTTAQAVDLLTTAINTYGGDATKAGAYTDVFAKAVERGKVTTAGLAEAFSIIGPIAASSGISIQEIGAGFARLTAAGEAAAEAATQMRSALVALTKTTPALDQLESKTKKSYKAIADKQGLVFALQELRTDAAKAGIPLIDLFGRIEGVQFALQTTGPNFKAYNADLAAMGNAAGTAAAQMAERQKGLNFQLARLKALAKDAGITIGTILLPKITPLVAKLNDFITNNQSGIGAFGDKLALLFSDANIKAGADALNGLFQTVKDLLPALQSGAEITGRVVKGAVDAFKSLPPEIQALAVAGLAVNKLTGGLVTNIAGGLISAVISSFRGLMNVNAAVVNVNGPVVGAGLPGIVPDAAGGGAAAVGGLTATAAAALVVAPLAIAAVGLALGKANDPTGEKTLAARAQTATARGIPDWNNKALQELKAIHAANADAASGTANDPIHTSSTDRQPGKALDDMTSALKTYLRMLNASQKLTPAQAEAIRTADRVARHAPAIGPFKKSDITPRLSFLGASHPGGQDVKVAAALVLGFETGEGGAAFRSTKDLKRTIEALRADQKTLGAKAAAIIGGYIGRLNTELKRHIDAAAAKTARAATIAGLVGAQATREKNLSVTLTNNTIINGRLFDATISRWTPARAAHGFRP